MVSGKYEVACPDGDAVVLGDQAVHPSSYWTIQLAGSFRVVRPDGAEVAMGSRKAKALVAMLALNRGIALSRTEIGAKLWPNKPAENQLQSLRQTIREVHRAFAPDKAIEATRDTCRLAFEAWRCDALDALDEGAELPEVLLPEMTEPVFEAWRSDVGSIPTGEFEIAARAALTVLEWARVYEPTRLFDLLYGVRDLLPHMVIPELEICLRSALDHAPRHQHVLWGQIQLSFALMWQGKSSEGVTVAKEVLKHAAPEYDMIEWTAAVFTASTFLLFRGRIDKALVLATSALEVAKTTRQAVAIDRISHAIAHCSAYRGDVFRALQLLNAMDDSAVDDLTVGLRSAHRSIYSSFRGLIEDARDHFFRAKSLCGENPDARLHTQLLGAEALLMKEEGEIEASHRLYQELYDLSDRYGIHLVQIQTLEGLAQTSTDEHAQRKFLQRATELRARHCLPLLPLDRMRLANLMHLMP